MKIEHVDIEDVDRQASEHFFGAVARAYDLHEMDALDAFARNGQLTVSHYAPWVKSVSCWELCNEHRAALEAIPGVTEVDIGCAYMTSDFERYVGGKKYDLVVIDSPMGFHTDVQGRVMCEHFNFLEESTEHLLKDRALVVLYVNKMPYDPSVTGHHGRDSYEHFDFNGWMTRRYDFYGSEYVGEADALAKYDNVFLNMGREVKSVLIWPCPQGQPGFPPAFRLVLEVVKIGS
jgi:hypothetical protein